ncbi:hypothetical protein Trydic_g2528 [Trypoxylus dichotomus]
MVRRPARLLKTIFVILVISCVVSLCLLLVQRHVDQSSEDEELDPDEVSTEDIKVNEIDFHEEEDTDLTLKDYPNFPAVFYDEDAKKPSSYNKSCAKFPALENLRFNNHYWQTLETPTGEYHLLGAYWDIRPKNKKAPTVRLLAMITPLKITEDLYCQFWFKDKVVVSGKTWHYFLWREAWGGNKENNYKPYLINCNLPKNYMNNHPVAVSLVKLPCDTPTNIMRITVNIPKEKKDFAVCVKGLDFHADISFRLMEWVELLKLLGADKVFFYELHVHEDVRRILEYYEEYEGIVEMTPVTLPGHYPNEPFLQHLFLHHYRSKKRLYELISYNDCLLKHMYEYKYIVLLDIDEIIVPSVGNWTTLMKDVATGPGKEGKSSYNARNIYFFDDYIKEDEFLRDIPASMHMLQHVYRIKDVMGSGLYIKSFHNTDLVLALHNHYPLYCVEPCRNLEIDPNKAKLHHYRKTCVKEIKNCDKLKDTKVKDTTLWTYKDQLIDRVSTLMERLEMDK